MVLELVCNGLLCSDFEVLDASGLGQCSVVLKTFTCLHGLRASTKLRIVLVPLRTVDNIHFRCTDFIKVRLIVRDAIPDDKAGAKSDHFVNMTGPELCLSGG